MSDLVKFMILSILAHLVKSQYSLEKTMFPEGNAPQKICRGFNMNKVYFNQSVYVNFVEYVAEIPDLESFHSCFWIKHVDSSRAATPLSYFFDLLENSNNLSVVWTGSPLFEMQIQIEGVPAAITSEVSFRSGIWSHICASWDGQTSLGVFYQDGRLAENKVFPEATGLKIRGGGTMVSGQMMNTRASGTGMDLGMGLEGELTLLHVSSSPLNASRSTQRLVRRLSRNCCAEDRGDIIGWLRTPRRGFAGVTEFPANQRCGDF